MSCPRCLFFRGICIYWGGVKSRPDPCPAFRYRPEERLRELGSVRIESDVHGWQVRCEADERSGEWFRLAVGQGLPELVTGLVRPVECVAAMEGRWRDRNGE
jgi:hypothetical protein